MKTSLRRALFTNFGWKVVAVAIATLLWYLLLREAELVAIRTVPVLLKNPPAELILTSSPGPVQVEVAGPVAVLEEAQFRGAAAVLDLGGIRTAGERTFTLRPQDFDLPLGAAFRRVTPSQLRLTFETRARRDVPVKLRVGAAPAAGWQVVDVRLEPASVTISGPRSRVAAVAFAETDPVDFSGITGETRLSANVALGDGQVTLESAPSVIVTAKVAAGRAQ